MKRKLILASNSPRRRELLKTLGVSFEVHSPEVVEKSSGSDLFKVVAANAAVKAVAISTQYPDALVLGADTAIIFQNRLIGKPASLADGRRMLAEFSGKTHQVVTGIALAVGAKIVENYYEVSEVKFKELSSADIKRYVKKVDILDKAGSYAIQEFGELIIGSYSGSMENIVGLPLSKLGALLPKYLGN